MVDERDCLKCNPADFCSNWCRERHPVGLFVRPVNFLISLNQTPKIVKGEMCYPDVSPTLTVTTGAQKRGKVRNNESERDMNDNKESHGSDDLVGDT